MIRTGIIVNYYNRSSMKGEAMFSKGEHVVYGSEGICEIMDVTTLNMKDVSKEKLYYIISPMNAKGSTIYIPVDYKKTIIRKIITREEAENLIERLPMISVITAANDKLREEKYKELTESGNLVDFITILKTVYLRNQKRQEQGKKATAVDEKYFRKAEFAVCSELSLSLNIPRENINEYITNRVNTILDNNNII